MKQVPMEASKWLQVQVLLEKEEMILMLQELGQVSIVQTGRVVALGEEVVPLKLFIQKYSEYVDTLKQGLLPSDSEYRPYFSAVLTKAPENLFAHPADSGRHIIRVEKPVVQMQLHRLGYSAIEGKFRAQVFGKDSIDWGIQFSYPQLFKDPKTNEAVKVGEAFPNTEVFRTIQRFLRTVSVPTPFLADGKKINSPIRLGKGCFSWINAHPKLIERGITVQR